MASWENLTLVRIQLYLCFYKIIIIKHIFNSSNNFHITIFLILVFIFAIIANITTWDKITKRNTNCCNSSIHVALHHTPLHLIPFLAHLLPQYVHLCFPHNLYSNINSTFSNLGTQYYTELAKGKKNCYYSKQSLRIEFLFISPLMHWFHFQSPLIILISIWKCNSSFSYLISRHENPQNILWLPNWLSVNNKCNWGNRNANTEIKEEGKDIPEWKMNVQGWQEIQWKAHGKQMYPADGISEVMLSKFTSCFLKFHHPKEVSKVWRFPRHSQVGDTCQKLSRVCRLSVRFTT